jgi:2-dehydropantoate 2-reductase
LAQARVELCWSRIGLVLKPAAIVRDNAVADIMRALVRECVAVGQMEGAIVDETPVEEVIDSYRRGAADAINSMHADRIAGRPLELDARNGAVVRFGRKHGIPTPVNQMMVTLLGIAAERTQDPQPHLLRPVD